MSELCACFLPTCLTPVFSVRCAGRCGCVAGVWFRAPGTSSADGPAVTCRGKPIGTATAAASRLHRRRRTPRLVLLLVWSLLSPRERPTKLGSWGSRSFALSTRSQTPCAAVWLFAICCITARFPLACFLRGRAAVSGPSERRRDFVHLCTAAIPDDSREVLSGPRA